MLTRPRLAVRALAVCLPALLAAPLLFGGAGQHDANTIFLLSAPNWPEARKGLEDGDMGAFLADPEVQAIKQRFQQGFSRLIQIGLDAAANQVEPGEKNPEDVVDLGAWAGNYCKALWADTTGGCSFSFALREAPGGPQPHFLLHFQGGEKFQQMHAELLNVIDRLAADNMVKITFEVGEVAFRGVQPAQMPAVGLPVTMPDGFFIGNKGQDYYIGISRGALEEYLAGAPAEGATAPTRIGDNAFYKKARSKFGSGHAEVLLNMEPLWRLVNTYMPMFAPDPSMSSILAGLGLDQFKGYYFVENFLADGTHGKGVMGINGRPGIWSLIPTENVALTPPSYVPRTTPQFVSFRTEFGKVLDLVMSMGERMMGPDAKTEIEEGLTEAQEALGVDPRQLLASLEGSLFVDMPGASGEQASPLGTTNVVFGVKLREKDTALKALEHLCTPGHESGLVKQAFLGRQLYVSDPHAGHGHEGDEAELSFDAPEQTMACTIDGDWFLMGTDIKYLKSALETKDAGPEAQLASDPRFSAAMAKLGSSGLGLSYVDNSRVLGDALDMMRPMMGFLPFMLGELGQDQQVMQLFDPRNLPSRAVLEKYFGVAVAAFRSSDDGLEAESWAPRVSAKPKPAPKGPEKL